MPSIGSKTKTVRFYAEDLEQIEGLVAEGMTFSGAVHRLISEKSGKSVGTPSKIEGIIGEFDEMASCSGISLDDLVNGIFTLLEDGTLMIENGSVVVSFGWASEFESVCHDLCIPVEKAAEGAIKALRKGSL